MWAADSSRFERVRRFLVSVLITSAVGVGIQALAEEPARGGILKVGLEADFPGFDPLSMGALVERMVSTAFYETLMDIDENGEIVPLLAESLDASSNGKVYTATLRQGIEFHDSTPFNAQAVESNFRRLMNPQNICRCAAEIEAIDSVQVIGEYEVEFRLKAPNAAFPAVLADVAGMQPSPTAIEKAGDGYGTEPVGTGPFRFVNWNRGVSLTVERNPDYWQDGLPYLDRIEYRPIPDHQTRMASLRSGDIHLSAVPAAQDVAAVKTGRYKLKLIEAPGLGTIFTMFNAQRPPLDDPRVRRALFHATDREAINTALNRGVYPLASSPFGPGMFGGELEIDFPAHDPDQARELLKAYGKPVSFTLSVTATPTNVRVVEILQQMWKQVGVDVNIEQLEQRTLIGKAIDSDFQAMQFRWPGRADPDLNSYQFFHSSSPRNYTDYSNPKLDGLLERGRLTLDPEERVNIYRQVAELLAEDGPYLFEWASTSFFLADEKLHGLPKIPDGLPRVGTVWLEP